MRTRLLTSLGVSSKASSVSPALTLDSGADGVSTPSSSGDWDDVSGEKGQLELSKSRSSSIPNGDKAIVGVSAFIECLEDDESHAPALTAEPEPLELSPTSASSSLSRKDSASKDESLKQLQAQVPGLDDALEPPSPPSSSSSSSSSPPALAPVAEPARRPGIRKRTLSLPLSFWSSSPKLASSDKSRQQQQHAPHTDPWSRSACAFFTLLTGSAPPSHLVSVPSSRSKTPRNGEPKTRAVLRRRSSLQLKTGDNVADDDEQPVASAVDPLFSSRAPLAVALPTETLSTTTFARAAVAAPPIIHKRDVKALKKKLGKQRKARKLIAELKRLDALPPPPSSATSPSRATQGLAAGEGERTNGPSMLDVPLILKPKAFVSGPLFDAERDDEDEDGDEDGPSRDGAAKPEDESVHSNEIPVDATHIALPPTSPPTDDHKTKKTGSSTSPPPRRKPTNGNSGGRLSSGSPLLSDFPFVPTPGNLASGAFAKSGAFDVLADVSANLRATDQDGKITQGAPDDSVTVFIYWWGYELAMPNDVVNRLQGVYSVSSTLFTFMQALVVAGGAPELAPYIRYLSLYLDTEWDAIKSQNQGQGVILASTWLLPVALVPRPWDIPVIKVDLKAANGTGQHKRALAAVKEASQEC